MTLALAIARRDPLGPPMEQRGPKTGRDGDATVGYETVMRPSDTIVTAQEPERPPEPGGAPSAAKPNLALEETWSADPPKPAASRPISGDTWGPLNASTVSLAETMAAPELPVTSGKLEPKGGSTSISVLPEITVEADGVRLLPSGGPRYRSVRSLGAGGMGEVHLVEDRDIGRTVAIKRLHPSSDRAAPALARFAFEVRTIGSLEHPNIVPIHDVGVDEAGRYFFVMKFVDGETLETIIEKLEAGDRATITKYPVQRRVEIFVGLLRALQYAHSRGIIHRDIKPANIMVGPMGEVVLMDWGVARAAGHPKEARTSTPSTPSAPVLGQTQAGALIGTPLYMSPEQAAGRNAELDARSDLYAACVVFHEMLGLRHVRHASKSLVELLAAIQTEDPPSLHTMFGSHAANPVGVPAELVHFLRRGLNRDPAKRWQSAEEMILELQGIAEGRVRVQCAATFSKRTIRELGRQIDRRPRETLISIGVGLALVTFMLAKAIYDLFS